MRLAPRMREALRTAGEDRRGQAKGILHPDNPLSNFTINEAGRAAVGMKG